MIRQEFNVGANDVFGVRFIKTGKRYTICVHRGDDGWYRDDPALEFNCFWTPSLIKLLATAIEFTNEKAETAL
jgi:hypothetical protein